MTDLVGLLVKDAIHEMKYLEASLKHSVAWLYIATLG